MHCATIPTTECTKPCITKGKCANCGLQHIASYKDIPQAPTTLTLQSPSAKKLTTTSPIQKEEILVNPLSKEQEQIDKPLAYQAKAVKNPKD